MGQIDNLNQGQLAALVARVDKLERASPMNNAAIGRGGVTVYDGGVIDIENGGLIVNGTATIHGVLNADGTISFTGPVTISGPLTITGDTTATGNFDVNGPMKTTGTLSVEGVTTLKNDLNVTTGKVKVGSALTIDPATDGGGLSFSTGAKLANYGGGIALVASGGGSILGVTSNGASIGTSAANILTSQTDGIVGVTGKLQVGTLPNTSNAANVYVDASGNFFRKV